MIRILQQRNKRLMITNAIGIILVLAGAFTPSATIVGLLRTGPVDGVLLDQLMLGALFFKIGLIVLGLFIMVAAMLPIWTRPGRTETLGDIRTSTSDIVILAVILLLATVIRLYGLEGGLWFDEIVTYVNYVQVPFGEAISTYDDQNQHILYSLLANLAFGVFGEGAWALRLPAVLFGTGSIWAMYLLGREVGSSREGLLSAALLAFSYHHVWFSQNARGYTGLLFFSILASWLFLRALRERSSWLWVFYAASVALGAYTLIYMVFVVFGHFVIYLIAQVRRRDDEPMLQRWSGLYLGFFLSGFLTFLLHSLIVPQFLTAFADAQVGGRIWTQPLWGILEFAKGMQANFSGSIVAVFAAALFAAGLWNYWRTRPEIVGLLFIPTVTCVVLKILMGHHLWPRSLFFAMGFGALIVVRGIMTFGDRITELAGRFGLAEKLMILKDRKANYLGAAMCLGLVVLSLLSVPFAYGPKQDFLGAQAFIEASRQPGDEVVTVGLATLPYKRLYKTNWEEAETVDALNSVRSRAKRTWLIYTIPIQLQDASPDIDISIRKDFKVVKQFFGTLNGGTIFVCQDEASLPDVAGLW